jgi:zinc transporter 9
LAATPLLRYNRRLVVAGNEKGAVFLALLGNGFLTIIKAIAFALSGSGAMLSEAIHSLADTGNQGLLFLGIRRSVREVDQRYNYGYGADRFLFALFSAMGIFVLGCGVTVYHGVEGILHPPSITVDWIIYAVLATSLLIDGWVFAKAVAEVNQRRGERGFFEFIRSSNDPTLIAVLFEDFVACFGVMVAFSGIMLAKYTGNAVWDGVSSIIIGALLGMVAVWLGYRNRQLILGPAIRKRIRQGIIDYLEGEESVQTVRLTRSRVLNADRFSMHAEIDYNGRYLGKLQAELLAELIESGKDPETIASDLGEALLDSLGKEVDRLEAELMERYPRLRHISLESDWNPDD